MADEERKFGDMEVTHAIHVGDREVLLLINPNSEEYSGDKSDWRRPDVLGILDPAKAPDWVKPGVAAIRAQLKEKGGKSHER